MAGSFDRFQFGFPLPEPEERPEGEFCIVKGTAVPLGPYLPLGPHVKEVCERERTRGFYHRSGNGTYAPTWLAVLRDYPTLRKFLTNEN
jgi:hypothetical protein